MAYIDGFVAPVLAGRDDDYRALARRMAPIFLEHGATQVVEALGDDVPRGQRTDLWRAVDAAGDERVVFSWIVWPDKAARARGWDAAMADPRMTPDPDMAFDAKRMIFGGFEIFLDTAHD